MKNKSLKDKFLNNYYCEIKKLSKKQINIKEAEILIQNCIEQSIDNNDCWWQHTKLNIFLLLLQTNSINTTALIIANDLK